MKTQTVEQDWNVILTMLPSDLETSARETRALVRRRGVASAADLLRLAMAYAYCGLSLRSTAAWAASRDIAQLSDVALLKRLRQAGPWIGQLLAQKLAEQVQWPQGAGTRLRVRVLDATSISGPGSQGPDWRVHLGFDLAAGCIVSAHPTPASEGETLTRHVVGEGELALADRGYAHRAGIHSVTKAGGQLIVRLNSNTVPLQTREGEPFDLLEAVRDLQPGEVAEFSVRTAPDGKRKIPAVAGRVVVLHKSQQATEQARRKLRRSAQRNGRTPDRRALQAAAYVVLFTTLEAEQLAATEVLALYRFRWQVELAFKRLKGIIALDEMAAKDERLCRTFLLTKLLAMLILEELATDYEALSPWGYGLPKTVVALAPFPQPGRDTAPRGGGRPHPRRVAQAQRAIRPRPPRHAAPQTKPDHASALSTRHLPNALSLS